MWTLVLGAIGFAVSLYLSSESGSAHLFFNMHAIAITAGGTVAILFLGNSPRALKNLFKKLAEMRDEKRGLKEWQSELFQLAQSRSLPQKSKNELIQYAHKLMQQGVESEVFIVLLSQKREKLEKEYADAALVLRHLAKYPPALGMIGTVMGVVGLFANLADGSREALGPSLAIAMTATFFGLAIAHAIVMPLSDRLNIHHSRRKEVLTDLYEVLLLINRNEPELLISQEVEHRDVA